jgi:hypothetical protein
MQQFPQVKFYAYTKMVSLINNDKYNLPNNFKYIYSYGGKEDNLIDINKDRHSKVFSSELVIPTNYINATDNDLLAIGDNKKIALCYHGAKSKAWTTTKLMKIVNSGE